VFEHRVGAIFLAEMLAEVPSDHFPCDRITGVGFQQGVHGHIVDDVVIEYEIAGRLEHFELDCKSAISLVPSNGDFRDVVDGCLTRHENIAAKPGIYGFATTINNHATDVEALKRLLDQARNEERVEQFEHAMNSPAFANVSMRRIYANLKAVCLDFCPTLTPAGFHDFLYRFRVVDIGADSNSGRDAAGAIFRIQNRLSKCDSEARAIFDNLIGLAGEMQGGFLRRRRLIERLEQRRVRVEAGIIIQSQSLELLDEESGPKATLSVVLSDAFADLRDIARATTSSDVLKARLALREGRHGECRALLADLKASPRWELLAAAERARVLILEARLELSGGATPESVSSLIAEAQALDPKSTDVTRLRLSVAAASEGPASVLPLLNEGGSLELIQLRAALLLDQNSPQEALDVLAGCDGNGETWRLRTLAYLLLEQRDSALHAASRGLDVDPEYQAMQFAAAIAAFDSALTPGIPSVLLRGHGPLLPSFVRSDQASMVHLQSAATQFAKMLSADQDSSARKTIETFFLACLCMQQTKQIEANDVLAKILADDPGHNGVIPWAIAYQLSFDVDAAVAALQGKFDKVCAAADIICLALIYGSKQLYSDTISLLRIHAALLVSSDYASQYYHLAFMASLNIEDLDGCSQLLLEAPTTVRTSLDALLLEHRAAATGEWDEAIDAYEKAHDAHPSASTLLPLAAALARAGQFGRVANLADRLLELHTQDAAELALQGLYNSGRFEDFLERLEFYAADSPISVNLEFARGQALEKLGRFTDALTTLKKTLRREPNSIMLSVAARLQVRLGDLAGLRETAKQLLSLTSVEPNLLMGLADLASVADRGVAIRLWRASAEGVTSEAVSAALSVGYRLGLDNEPAIEKLTLRLVSGEAPAQRYTFEELKALFSETAVSGRKVIERYNEGLASIHMLADQMNISLPAIYSDAFDRASPNLNRPVVFTRYGGRADAVIAMRSDARLNIDITSLLIFCYIGLFDDLIGRFQLRIPAETIDILNASAERLTPAQPSVVERDEALLSRLEFGGLESVTQAELEIAPKGTLFGPAEDSAKGIRPVSELIEGVKAGRKLPGEVYLVQGAILQVANTEVFTKLIDSAIVSIPAEEKQLLQLQRAQRLKRQTTLTSVRDLVGRLQSGLGVWYSNLPAVNVSDSQFPPNSSTTSLLSLVQMKSEHNDVIIADDRLVSGFVGTEAGVQVIGTYDLLTHLAQAAIITGDRYRASIDRLLEANCLFLPVDGDRISRELLAAPIDAESGNTVETSELAGLRRYVARTLRAKPILQRPGTASSAFPYGETAVLLGTSRAVGSALAAIWESDQPEDQKLARSDYLLRAFYFDDQPSLSAATLFRPDRDPTDIVAFSLTALLMRPMGMPTILENGRQYVRYIVESIIEPRLSSDPALEAAMALHLRQYILMLLGDDDDGRRIRASMLKEVISGLPSRLLRAIAQDRTLEELFGIKQVPIVLVNEEQFNLEHIWSAAARYLSTGTAQQITSYETGRVFSLIVDGTTVALSDNGSTATLSEPALALLQTDAPRITTFLKANSHWFDMPREAREQFYAEASKLTDSIELIRCIAQARNENATKYYLDLANPASPIEVFPLPRSINGVLQHLRMAPADARTLARRLGDAATELLNDVGLLGAVARLAILPTVLPEVIHRAFARVDADARRAITDKLLIITRVPTALYNVANLVLRAPGYSGRDEHVTTLTRQMTGQLDSPDLVPAYLDVVKAICDRVVPGNDIAPIDRRLVAWYHAGRLFDSLIGRGVLVEQIREVYQYPTNLVDMLKHSKVDLVELGAPESPHLILTGLAYGFGKHSELLDREQTQAWKANLLVGGAALPGVMLPDRRGGALITARSYLPDLAALFGDGIAAAYRKGARRQAQSEAALDVKQDPNNFLAWTVLRLCPVPISQTNMKRIRRAATSFSFAELLSTDVASVHTMRAILGVPELLAEPATRASLLLSLDALADYCSESGRVARSSGVAAVFNDAALAVSSFEPSLNEGARVYAGTVSRFVQRWPSFLSIAGPFIDYMARRTPVAQSQAFTPLILNLRSL
jgi:tetratricopeptide (TPR) repeat protein